MSHLALPLLPCFSAMLKKAVLLALIAACEVPYTYWNTGQTSFQQEGGSAHDCMLQPFIKLQHRPVCSCAWPSPQGTAL